MKGFETRLLIFVQNCKKFRLSPFMKLIEKANKVSFRLYLNKLGTRTNISLTVESVSTQSVSTPERFHLISVQLIHTIYLDRSQ